MKNLIVAVVSTRNYIGQADHSIEIMKRWVSIAKEENGYYSVVCNSAGGREPNEWEPRGRRFPGWAGVISPWGRVIAFVDDEGNNESIVIEELDPEELEDRRNHPNFLAEELRVDLYEFGE